MRNGLDFYSKEAIELLKKRPPFLIRIGTFGSFLTLASFFCLSYFIPIPIRRETKNYTWFAESDSFVVAAYMSGWNSRETVDSARWEQPAGNPIVVSFKAHHYYFKNDSIYFYVDKKQAYSLSFETKFLLYSHRSLFSTYYTFWINHAKDE